MRTKFIRFSLSCLLAIAMSTAAYAQEVTIRGKVTDLTGANMAGVTVTVKTSGVATVTDKNGTYSIKVPLLDTLLYTNVGYGTYRAPVLNSSDLNVQLTAQAGTMEEVAVVGFGRQRKVSIVGAVETIRPAELRTPTANLSNSLGGRMSGVIAVQRTGAPGADGSNFFIRGLATYSGKQSPLIILDGVEISVGDMQGLSPEIIESFSLLKDASATAIYGNRGANGVVIITTKVGRNMEKARINVRIQNQVSTPTSVPKFVDGVTFMTLNNEAVIARGNGTLYTIDKIEGTRSGADPYLFPNVNWYDAMFKKSTQNQEVNINIQGGGPRTGYFMSVTANNSNGLLRNFDLNSYDNNINLKRYVFQNNLNAEITPTTKVNLRLNTQLRYYKGPASGDQATFGNIMNANPVDFPMYYSLDSARAWRDIRFGGKSGGTMNDGFINPFAEMIRGYTNNFQSTVLATLDGEQKLDFITKGLSLKALVSFKNFSNSNTVRTSGYNQFEIKNYTQGPSGYVYPLSMVGTSQNLSLTTTNASSGDRFFYIQPSIDYIRTFGRHSINSTIVYSQNEYDLNAPTDLISSLPKRREGLAGRLNYNFDNRYSLEGNLAYNGSENFAKNSRWGLFPSIGASYVISNEKFFRNRIIDYLKIRGTYGMVGNDEIGGARFPYLANLNLGGRGFTTGIDMNTSYSGPTYTQFANPDITWEKAYKADAGIEINFLKGFNLVVELYREHRKNIFGDISSIIPTTFGTAGTVVYANIGEVKNQGIDVVLGYNKRVSSDLNFSSRATFTYAKNKILAYPEPAVSQYPNLARVGSQIGSLYGYQAERLFIDDIEVGRSPVQQLGGFSSAGDIKYTDITAYDGLNIINANDRVKMGYPSTPEIQFGLMGAVTYKKAELNFLFDGVAHTSFFMSGIHPFGSQGIRSILQFVADDHWSPSNPDVYAAYPKLSKLDNPNNTSASSYWLRDGSFVKLRTLELAYNVKPWLRIFASGYNLITFSKFKLWDPEQGGGNGLVYPTQRVYNLGVQLNFQ